MLRLSNKERHYYHPLKGLSVVRSFSYVIYLLLGIGATQVVAAPQAELIASRLSGPAPLAVFFDATGTTDTDQSIDAFRELGYAFDFGDINSGNWQYSGVSKNTETGGPLAAHVFDFPGTYTVGVKALNADGDWSEAWVRITVTDPDIVYADADTIVMSTGTDFTDAPTDAARLANLTAWPSWQSNKRYLLRAGDDFSALGLLRIKDRSDFQVATFGSGPKPIVDSVMVHMDEDNAATPPKNGMIRGLATRQIVQYQMFTNILIYQNELIASGANINFAAANGWYALNKRGASAPQDWQHPGPVFIVENHVNMQGNITGPLNGIAGLAHHTALLGNFSEQSKEHSIRIFGTYKSVIGHNKITGPATDSIRHDLKLMANGTNSWPADNSIFKPGTTDEVLPNTRYVRIHNNIVGRTDSPNYWHIQVAPQDDGSSGTVEGLQDVIVEGNQFIDGNADDGLERGLHAFGRNIIVRGNHYPTEWSEPVLTVSFPSNYSAYSPLYTGFWHGPYYLSDPETMTAAPSHVDYCFP